MLKIKISMRDYKKKLSMICKDARMIVHDKLINIGGNIECVNVL